MSDTGSTGAPNDALLPADDPDTVAPFYDPDDPKAPEWVADYSDQERQLERLFRPNAEDDPDATDPGPDETQAEPSPEPPDPDDPATTPPPMDEEKSVGGPVGAGGVPSQDVGTTPPTPPVPVSPEEPEYINIGGRMYPAERAAEILQLIDLGIAKVQETPLGAPQPPVAPTPTEPDVPAFNPESFVDPELARWTQAQIEATKAANQPLMDQLSQVSAYMQAQQQAEQQRIVAGIDAAEQLAVEDVKSRYQLDDAEFAKLYDTTKRSGIVNGFVQADQSAGNPDRFQDTATRALEAMYWASPEFRERTIAQQVSTEVAEKVQNQKITEKKSRAGTLAGGGGTVTRTPPAKPAVGATGSTRDPIAIALEAAQAEAV